LALASACATSGELPAGDRLVAYRVETLPTVADHRLWGMIPGVGVRMDGQTMTTPTRAMSSVEQVDLCAIHDGERIAFHLSWWDSSCDDLTVPVSGFRDAVAVLLAPFTTDPAMRFMGTPDSPATILHWKADWQRDIDRGFQDLEAAFPRAAVDYHPPLSAGADPVGGVTVPKDYDEHNAKQWLPGYRVGNPISQPIKSSPVEKLIANGFGTLATLPTQDAAGHGVWSHGRWRVMMSRRRPEKPIHLRCRRVVGLPR